MLTHLLEPLHTCNSGDLQATSNAAASDETQLTAVFSPLLRFACSTERWGPQLAPRPSPTPGCAAHLLSSSKFSTRSGTSARHSNAITVLQRGNCCWRTPTWRSYTTGSPASGRARPLHIQRLCKPMSGMHVDDAIPCRQLLERVQPLHRLGRELLLGAPAFVLAPWDNVCM